MGTKLERISQLSRENPDMVFTSIGHLINKELLRECHERMDGEKAVAIDGVTIPKEDGKTRPLSIYCYEDKLVQEALMIFDRHPEYRERYNRHFWARGYYCETVGNVNEETIKKYIEEQYERDRQESDSEK